MPAHQTHVRASCPCCLPLSRALAPLGSNATGHCAGVSTLDVSFGYDRTAFVPGDSGGCTAGSG